MTTALTISHELGENADLLVRPDQWLENQRQDLASKVSILLDELEGVQKAIWFKRQLQQANHVAVLLTEREKDGKMRDVAIKVMPLMDAVKLLSQPVDDIDRANLTAQFYTWTNDGYDLPINELRRMS